MTLSRLRHRTVFALVAALLTIPACSPKEDRRPITVDAIGKPVELTEPLRNSTQAAAKVLLGATAQGLLRFDSNGEIIGGLAERWIVEDNGQSYIFRLRRARWSDGKPVKAQEVAKLLNARIIANPTLFAGLEPEVRGMTDEVIEIALAAPSPSFMQLVAQPALAIAQSSGGTGPLQKSVKNGIMILRLPEVKGGAEEDTETDQTQAPPPPVHLRASRAPLAFVRFAQGQSDLVLGGRFQHLPYGPVAHVPVSMVRADPVNGLFGLMIEGKTPFLQNKDAREILAMAIDRDWIAKLLNLNGWQLSTTILPGQLDLGRAPTRPGWADRALELRRSYARSVVTNWAHMNGPIPTLTIALPAGPGARMLYYALANDFTTIGLSLETVPWDAPADLRLIDEVAPFDSALWYLARVACPASQHCDKAAKTALDLDKARAAKSDEERSAALGAAETAILAENIFIPIGQPIRFSLVRPRLTGFQPSPRAIHPLTSLIQQRH
jgi:peptide/nickel transport system substrate-binding protein